MKRMNLNYWTRVRLQLEITGKFYSMFSEEYDYFQNGIHALFSVDEMNFNLD
jgi:hypothetical protein